MILWTPSLLQIILALVCKVVSQPMFNTALWKPAQQSSNYDGNQNLADKAVDGVVNNHLSKCASTPHGDWNPWWRVDLLSMYPVDTVLVTNRNAYAYRLHDFNVTVSAHDSLDSDQGTLCGYHQGQTSNVTTNVKCQQVIWGRYVTITKRVDSHYDILTICEVEVMVQKPKNRYTFEKRQGKQNTRSPLLTAMTNLPGCARQCKATDDCTSFNHNGGTGECMLFPGTSTEGIGFTDHAAWDLYRIIF